jgi:hypothetical protein
MLRGNANEIMKGKANQRDKESTDTNNGGGFQYSLPDTVRLRKKIILIIKEHFSRGATWLDIKGEAIYIELDNFTAEYLVPDRRKQSALKDLVKGGRLTAKGKTKTYMIVPEDDTIPLSEKVWVLGYFSNCIQIVLQLLFIITYLY